MQLDLAQFPMCAKLKALERFTYINWLCSLATARTLNREATPTNLKLWATPIHLVWHAVEGVCWTHLNIKAAWQRANMSNFTVSSDTTSPLPTADHSNRQKTSSWPVTPQFRGHEYAPVACIHGRCSKRYESPVNVPKIQRSTPSGHKITVQ